MRQIILSLFLLIPFTSFAADIASGTTGTCKWVIDADGNLTVSPISGDEGTMDDACPWEDNIRFIKTVTFCGIVHAPNSCNRMFYNCKYITSIDFGDFDTSNVTDMFAMFDGCSSITFLDVTCFNTQNVTDMCWMFAECSGLASLNVSYFNTQSVTSMMGMFSGCSSLTSLDVSSFDTQNVTNMLSMFSGCSSLTSLDVSSFDTQNVTNMAGIFNGCSCLESLDLTNFTNIHVFNNNRVFMGCEKLKAIYSYVELPTAVKAGTFANSLPTIGTCKLYVPLGSVDAYKSADGWKELNIVGKGGSIVLEDATLYDNDETIAYDEISYIRNFNNTNWQALYIPFSMSYDDWKDNFEVARINAFFYNNGDVNDQYLNVIKVTSGSLEPNTPYLIKAREAGEKTIKVENATLYPAVENYIDCASIDFRYVFTGTYKGVSGEEMLSEQYFAMTGGSLKRASSASAKLSPYRWYVKEESRHGSTSSAKPSVINIVVEGEDDTTGILNLTPETGNQKPETIYNLQGQSVDAGQLAPGIYIKNGKKFIVK